MPRNLWGLRGILVNVFHAIVFTGNRLDQVRFSVNFWILRLMVAFQDSPTPESQFLP
jgi:hypothetical protein